MSTVLTVIAVIICWEAFKGVAQHIADRGYRRELRRLRDERREES